MVFFFSFSLPSFFFRNGILKQPATEANSQDNRLNNLHNVRVQEEGARQSFKSCDTV